VCPAFYSRNLRAANNLTTYRYQYAGNFTNVTPFWWMGAYHASDVPPVFGTYNISGGATEFEAEVADKMQNYILAFLQDPENGLKKLGWQPDNSETDGTMIRFAADGVLEKVIQSSDVDDACIGLAQYNSRPS
jgi:carboxylesterase type B